MIGAYDTSYTFTFGRDTIMDFEDSTEAGADHDVLQFDLALITDADADGALDAGDVLALASEVSVPGAGTDVVITFDSENSVTIKNTSLANLTVDHILLV